MFDLANEGARKLKQSILVAYVFAIVVVVLTIQSLEMERRDCPFTLGGIH